MPAHLIDSSPIQTTYVACSSGSAGDVYEDDGALSGSMNDELATVVTNTDHPMLDEGAQFVNDHAAGSPQRPSQLGLIDGSNGVANSDEFGPIPGVDDSTPESIARITRKYSLVEVVDGSLIKAPSEFPDVSSSPLSGCPAEGSEASLPGAVLPCDLESGLVHTLTRAATDVGGDVKPFYAAVTVLPLVIDTLQWLLSM
ncbi:hypothetical protein Nepgr_016356 [Nepenthes gracilis]|uniref:Uncharacterized protein n=1 Tax=Nepenthes gracilis TaxID=150966 RepID=A0AAD3SPM4_NEPGR|nr:hypothetical protein Nepgr_016356 [Nepenthes gracilis]